MKPRSLKGEINIYPNPTTDELRIALPHLNAYRIYIYDIEGRLLIEHNYAMEEEVFDLSQFANGTYIVSVYQNNNEVQSSKIIVSR